MKQTKIQSAILHIMGIAILCCGMVACSEDPEVDSNVVDKEVLENPAIYPSDEVINNLYVQQVRPLKAQRSMTRIWTGVKTGRK